MVSVLILALFAAAVEPLGPEDVRHFLGERMDGSGTIVATYRRQASGRIQHHLVGYDLASGAWFKIYDGKVFGWHPRTGYYAGDEHAGVEPRTATKWHDDWPPDRFFPFLYVYQLLDLPGAVQRIDWREEGGMVIEAQLPGGSLYRPGQAGDASSKGVVVKIDERGYVLGIELESRQDRRHSYEPNAPAGFPLVQEVNPGYGDWKLIDFEHFPAGRAALFEPTNVEARAIQARTGTQVSRLQLEAGQGEVTYIDEGGGTGAERRALLGAGVLAMVIGGILWWKRSRA